MESQPLAADEAVNIKIFRFTNFSPSAQIDEMHQMDFLGPRFEVVFINPKSPWMNGSIENFNGWFEEKFWAKETFTNLEDMHACQINAFCWAI